MQRTNPDGHECSKSSAEDFKRRPIVSNWWVDDKLLYRAVADKNVGLLLTTTGAINTFDFCHEPLTRFVSANDPGTRNSYL